MTTFYLAIAFLILCSVSFIAAAWLLQRNGGRI